ncbi:MAG: T9SS type A sorting domain-containing protein, partial [Bacteroidales bacterium]|nr:T9SS type A sorting domain-containing protein [Bacteroidales bacterium]
CIAKPIDFYTPSDAGYLNLYVTLTDAYGESITLADGLMITDCPTTLTENESASHFNFYPNPATDKLHLELPNNAKPQQAEIYNVQAQLVLSQEINSKVLNIDISKLSPGRYILKINGKSKSFTVVR